jgi:hypothetical protein
MELINYLGTSALCLSTRNLTAPLHENYLAGKGSKGLLGRTKSGTAVLLRGQSLLLCCAVLCYAEWV